MSTSHNASRRIPAVAGDHPSRTLLAVFVLAVGFGTASAGLPDSIFANGFEADCGNLLYAGDFPVDSANWPAPWSVVANSAALADVSAGESRLRPVVTGYSLARMVAPVQTRDVEVRFSMLLEDATAQGVGFYVRQNGGHTTLTNPVGQGYAVFVEGTFRNMPGVGLWKEQLGQEIQIAHSGPAAPAPQTGVRYQVALQVQQNTPTTTAMRARIWAVGSPEPGNWQVEVLDSTAVLQQISGGIAVDSWNVATSPAAISANTRVDDIEIRVLCAQP